jgi:dynein light chain roadblock-type
MGADALEETLSRLSKKPGVKATIALDRATGTILKSAGQISSLRTSSSQQQVDSQPPPPAAASSLSASTTDVPASSGSAAAAGTGSETQGAQELASMVWTFVNSTGGLVHGLDTEVILQFQDQENCTVLTASPG